MTTNPDVRHKVLLTSDFGVGKSLLLLDFSTFVEGDFLSIDYERGQDFYVAPSRAQANRAEGIYYVNRLVAPTLYELKVIVQKVMNPSASVRTLSVDKHPVDTSLLSEPVRTLLQEIHQGKVQITGIGIDTVTRLCELTVRQVFDEHIARYGIEKTERMSQLVWSKTKDDLSEVFYQIINSGLHLIMAAWAKPRWDPETRQSTRELVADVLRNINGFVDLTLLLEPNPKNAPARGVVLPPQARVLKSRLRKLPAGGLLPEATWEKIFAAQPQFANEVSEAPATPTPSSAGGTSG